MRRIGILMLVVFFCFVSTTWSQAQPQWNHKIITYEAPGAGTGAGQGTQAPGINPAGAITGFYWDDRSVAHGFLRSPDGRFTTFDVPGAGKGFALGTEADNINSMGTIAGSYADANSVWHGFLRTPDGKITKFDVRGAGTEAGLGTVVEWAACLNDAGMITGNYVDANGVSHGCVRARDGKITKFDVEGAGTG